MPYVMYDDDSMPEGAEPADVVPREEYVRVVEERDELVTARDGLADQLSVTMADLEQSREKYANAVLTSAQRVKREQAADVHRDGGPQTFAELFSRREGM